MRKVATMPFFRLRKVNKGVFANAHGVQFASFDSAPKALARDAQDLRRFTQSD
jgi:hypothetical protein